MKAIESDLQEALRSPRAVALQQGPLTASRQLSTQRESTIKLPINSAANQQHHGQQVRGWGEGRREGGCDGTEKAMLWGPVGPQPPGCSNRVCLV